MTHWNWHSLLKTIDPGMVSRVTHVFSRAIQSLGQFMFGGSSTEEESIDQLSVKDVLMFNEALNVLKAETA